MTRKKDVVKVYKPVFLVDEHGEVVRRFANADMAAAELGMTRQAVQYHCQNRTRKNLRYAESMGEVMADREVWCKWCRSFSKGMHDADKGWCMRHKAQRKFFSTCGEFTLDGKYDTKRFVR